MSQTVIDTLGVEAHVWVTVPDNSPARSNAPTLGSLPDHSLRVGDETVFFLKRVTLGWREGRQERLMLIGNPEASYRLRGPDGRFYPRVGLP